MFHEPGGQPLWERVQSENKNKLAYIQVSLFHLNILRVHIVAQVILMNSQFQAKP